MRLDQLAVPEGPLDVVDQLALQLLAADAGAISSAHAAVRLGPRDTLGALRAVDVDVAPRLRDLQSARLATPAQADHHEDAPIVELRVTSPSRTWS